MEFVEMPCQESGIQEPRVKQERDAADNEDSEMIDQQYKGTSDDEGNIPKEEIKYEVTSDDDNDNTQISDNIESHSSQVLSNYYVVDDVKFDISEMLDNIKDETSPGSSNVGRNQALLDEDIPLRGLKSRKRIKPSEDTEDNVFLELENDVNPGSDVEPNEDVIVEYHSSLIRSEDDLPADLVRFLDEMDNKDVTALRETASSNPDMLHFNWSTDPDKFVGKQEVFTGKSGPTFRIDGLTPLAVFQRIWDADIMETIVRETNRYGRQLYATKDKPWSDIDGNDIWIFLALLILQSILILPVEREYWYPCLAQLKVGNFNDIMPFTKFTKIKQSLHFVDNKSLTTVAGEDQKLQKICPIVEHLNRKFSSLYLPDRYIAIDESLLHWKGRLSFIQLIATKAAREGIKSYELCDSRTGYLWKMLLYTGKGDESHLSQNELEGATSKIVYNLVRPLLDKGHTLVMDNFHNSPLLSRVLKTKKTDTMGTIRLKREFVPEAFRNITKSNIRQGEVIYSHTEDLVISAWNDGNIGAMISTYHSPLVGEKEKYKPQVVLDYNTTMGGVDKKNQMLQAFPVERVRNLSWYKKLFRRLLNVSIHNSFVIYNHYKNGSQRKFRVALAKEILEKLQGQLPDPRKEKRRTGHFPTKAETNRSRCKMCLMKKVQTRTAYKCDTCNVNLCIIGCFKEYHLME